jgi:phage gp45-like
MWDKLMRRLKLILSVGNVITTNQTTQTVDFAHGEMPENIKYAQGYGIEVYPLPGSKALTIFNAGDRSQGITVLTVDRRYTHDLAPGDVMVYDKRNQFIHLKDSGIDIEVVGDLNINATGNINMNATKINLN